MLVTVVVDSVVGPQGFENVIGGPEDMNGVVDEQVAGVSYHESGQKREGILIEDQLEEHQQYGTDDDAHQRRHGQPLLVLRIIVMNAVHGIGNLLTTLGSSGHVINLAVHDIFHEGEYEPAAEEKADDAEVREIRDQLGPVNQAGSVEEKHADGYCDMRSGEHIEPFIFEECRRYVFVAREILFL